LSIGCGLIKDESAGEEIIRSLYLGPFKRLPPGLHQVYSCFRPSNDNYRAPKPPIFADRLAAASGIYCGDTHTPPHTVAVDFPRSRASSTRMDRGSVLYRTIALPFLHSGRVVIENEIALQIRNWTCGAYDVLVFTSSGRLLLRIGRSPVIHKRSYLDGLRRNCAFNGGWTI
jgi:hypothetical protein